jgi:hypothetical protein
LAERQTWPADVEVTVEAAAIKLPFVTITRNRNAVNTVSGCESSHHAEQAQERKAYGPHDNSSEIKIGIEEQRRGPTE